jgi:glutaredoxin/glutathione-dependent peroxiredoxin
VSRTGHLTGCRIPPAQLSELRDRKVTPIDSGALLGKGRVAVAGAPDASGPVGYGHYLRGLIVHAGRLRKSGYDEIVCVVTSDPFAVDAWSKSLDPEGKVRFVSDEKLELARALDLIAHGKGDRSEHYMLTLRHGVIETARLESPGADEQIVVQDDSLYL